MSGGRFRLGLGAGVKRLNETWHDVEYGKPAPHLRETIEATRLIMEQATSGEPIRFEGEYHDIDIKGWIRPHKPVRDRVPIYAAAMREGMCRMARRRRRRADRPPDVPAALARRGRRPELREGPEALRRQRSDLDFLPTVCCAIDDDEARAIDAARRTIAFYATVRTYRPLWEMHGFADAAQAAGDAFRKGDLAAVPERDPRRDGRGLHGRRPARQGPRARSRRSPSAATASSSRPPTYFIPPEQLLEYQTKIVEAFGPGVALCRAVGRLVGGRRRTRRTCACPDRGAVPEEDELRLEGREPFRGTAVLSGVGGQVGLRLVQPGIPVSWSMFVSTSPRISTPSDSRQKAT